MSTLLRIPTAAPAPSNRNLLTIAIFIGLFLGGLAGWLIGEPVLSVAEPLAELFLRLLRMAIIPLIITSIISGVVSVGDASGLGRLGLKTLSYYIVSSLIAIITGLILVNIFAPGINADIGLEKSPEGVTAANQSIQDLLLRIIPENPFQAAAQGDVLPVIFFCILFGYFITRLKKGPKEQLSNFFQAALKKRHHIAQMG